MRILPLPFCRCHQLNCLFWAHNKLDRLLRYVQLIYLLPLLVASVCILSAPFLLSMLSPGMHLNLYAFFRNFCTCKNPTFLLSPCPIVRPSLRHHIHIIPEYLPHFSIPVFPAYLPYPHPPPSPLWYWYLCWSQPPSSFHITRNCTHFDLPGQDAVALYHTPPQTNISAIPHLFCCRPCCPTYLTFPSSHLTVSPPSLSWLYHISDGDCIHIHFGCFPFLLSMLSCVSTNTVVILLYIYCSPHHIILHRPTTLTDILFLHLCHVSVITIYEISAYLIPLYSLNPQSTLPLSLIPEYQLPPFSVAFLFYHVYYWFCLSSSAVIVPHWCHRRIHHFKSPPGTLLQRSMLCISNTPLLYFCRFTWYSLNLISLIRSTLIFLHWLLCSTLISLLCYY